MTSATPSQPWPCKTAWTSRPSAVCWVTTRRASRWTPTPTSPPTPNSKRRKQWAISYPVRYSPFRYPLPLGSAFGSEKSGIPKWQLMKSKSPQNQTISRTFGRVRQSGYFPDYSRPSSLLIPYILKSSSVNIVKGFLIAIYLFTVLKAFSTTLFFS